MKQIIFFLFTLVLVMGGGARADHLPQQFTPNAVIYACKPDGSACGWHPAKVIFLQCREQLWKDDLTLVESMHIYCSELQFIVPENIG